MTKIVEIGTPPIPVHLRRSARARRYSLKVSSTNGQIQLVLPTGASEREAVSFAQKQEAWLRAAIRKIPAPEVPGFGSTILFEGREVQVIQGTGRSIRFLNGILEVPGKPEMLNAKLRGFLKVTARERLVTASHRYAKLIDREVLRVTLRDTRTRWGSCTHSGNLMFSWRLIMAPSRVLEYVAAHEVAHLIELNHSSAFWRVVEDLQPSYREPKKWLKDHGSTLHRYRF